MPNDELASITRFKPDFHSRIPLAPLAKFRQRKPNKQIGYQMLAPYH